MTKMYNRLLKKISYIKISGDKTPIQTTRHGEDHKLKGASHIQDAAWSLSALPPKPALGEPSLCDPLTSHSPERSLPGSVHNRPGASLPQCPPRGCGGRWQPCGCQPTTRLPAPGAQRREGPPRSLPSGLQGGAGLGCDGSCSSGSLLLGCLLRRRSCGHDDSGDRFGGGRGCSLLEMGRGDRLDAHLFAKGTSGQRLANRLGPASQGEKRTQCGHRAPGLTCVAWPCCWSCCSCWAVRKLTGLLPAMSLVPAGMVVRMMLRPNPPRLWTESRTGH